MMDATKTAGGEDVDAGGVRQQCGRGDGGASVLAGDGGVGQVADRCLGDVVVVGQFADLVFGETDDRLAVTTPIVAGTPPAARTISSPASATSTLRGRGQTVGEDGRFKGDDGGVVGNGLLHGI